jgi:hypothetical protein
MLVLAFVVVNQCLAGIALLANEKPTLPVGSLNEDRLGESLKSFRSRHKEAKCHRRPNDASDEQRLKEEWLAWVDCGLERGIKFYGVELYAEANSSQPFGMFATFHEKKLVDLSYTLATQSVKDLLPTMIQEFGKPSLISVTEKGDLNSITWIGQTENIAVELVQLSPVSADGNYLKVHKGDPTHAVRVRVCLNTMLSRDP